MNHNPISDAFESVDMTPSAAFRQRLRGEFLAAVVRHEVSDGIAGGNTVNVIETARPPRRRWKVVLGAAASIAIVAALTAIVLNRSSEPNAIDTSRDPAIAGSSLMSPKQVGLSWQINHQYDSFTSRDVAGVAATVPACAAYLNYAFDSPERLAATAGRIFSSPPLYALTQWVYIFPTEAAAKQAIDKIAEASFVPCFNQFMDALSPRLAGSPSNTTTVEPPPLADHGDRQVVLGQSVALPFGTYQVMNVFVQVGRGIVFVNPTPDALDSLDAGSRLEKVIAAATDDLTTALATAGR
ncbi:MAG: hypothetical protein QOJ66_275 [Ilumatobacteraceae bacterium]|jgi:hypothetical protein